MNNKNYPGILLVLGGLSGYISHILVWEKFQFDPVNNYYPGVIFGLMIAIYFFFFKKIKIAKLMLFVAASTISYALAVQTMVNLVIVSFFLALVLGGIVGSFILLLSFNFLILKLSSAEFIFLLLLGGFLGLSWFSIPQGTLFGQPDTGGLAQENILSVFLFWQAIMAEAIGLVTNKKKLN